MSLTLAPRSQRALSICISPMQHGIEKLPGSRSLDGNRLCKSALQDPPMGATEASPSFSFLDRSSLKPLMGRRDLKSFQEGATDIDSV